MICELCGRHGTERHHVFFGTANRKKSERWGMVAELCPGCHRHSRSAVHSCRATDIVLKRRYQRKFEEQHSRALFMAEFGRNYL